MYFTKCSLLIVIVREDTKTYAQCTPETMHKKTNLSEKEEDRTINYFYWKEGPRGKPIEFSSKKRSKQCFFQYCEENLLGGSKLPENKFTSGDCGYSRKRRNIIKGNQITRVCGRVESNINNWTWWNIHTYVGQQQWKRKKDRQTAWLSSDRHIRWQPKSDWSSLWKAAQNNLVISQTYKSRSVSQKNLS